MEKRVTISSRDNPRLSHIRKVRDGRIADEVFAEGVRLCEEVLRADLAVTECAVTPQAMQTDRVQAILSDAAERGARVNEIPEVLFKSIAETANSQGLIILAKRPATGLAAVKDLKGATLLVYLQKIGDPSNLGAVFRTAEAVGVDGVVLSSGSADPFSPKALRSSLGSSLRLPVWDQAGLEEFVDWADQEGIQVIGADISGTKTYLENNWTIPSAIVMGSEAHGLTNEELRLVSDVVTIPMRNGVESLNLAVSAGILLYEAVRQRRTI